MIGSSYANWALCLKEDLLLYRREFIVWNPSQLLVKFLKIVRKIAKNVIITRNVYVDNPMFYILLKPQTAARPLFSELSSSPDINRTLEVTLARRFLFGYLV